MKQNKAMIHGGPWYDGPDLSIFEAAIIMAERASGEPWSSKRSLNEREDQEEEEEEQEDEEEEEEEQEARERERERERERDRETEREHPCSLRKLKRKAREMHVDWI